MKHWFRNIRVPGEFTSIMFSIVIDPCLPPLTYRRPRLRAYFATPDTSRREAKNRRRNHRSLAIGDVREFANRSRVTHSRFSIIAEPRIASTSLREEDKTPRPLTPPPYNRRRTYVYFRIGWDNRGVAWREGRRGGRTWRPRSDRSKDSWGRDGRSIGGNGHRSGKNEVRITRFAIDRFRKRPLTKLCTLVVLRSTTL